ncbi:DUF1343 domain-containing protein [candidate division KSB1 bacterium]|nr:DUF1343 domain-containing protein [candidate division KSB1 bacterium]
MRLKRLLFSLLILGVGCGIQGQTPVIKPGVEILLQDRIDLVKGKRVGLITNPTGVTSALISTIDALHAHPQVDLVALYGPEHGVRGDIAAGEKVSTYLDPKTNVPVHSLYGETRKPTPEMLEGVDVLLYDIQDIGVRSYTYIYTMAYAMEAAKEQGIPFVVLDRPNPLGGTLVEGPMWEPEFKSFIGLYPISYIYGLTVGELAKLFNNEFGIHCELSVVHMQGWTRDMVFSETGLPWVPTSPHIPHALTSFFYPLTGIIGELNTVNIGVGYTMPFELVGAPWIDSEELASYLNTHDLPGVYFRPLHYRPYYYHFQGEEIQGIHIYILDTTAIKPVATQMVILTALHKLYPEQTLFSDERIAMFDKASGSDKLRNQVLNGWDAERIIQSWQDDLSEFKKMRQKYIYY